MKYPIEIRSKNAFVSWAQDQQDNSQPQQFYMRMSDHLIVHVAEQSDLLYGRFVPFELPKTRKEAEKLWRDNMEGEITVFMVSGSDMTPTWCVVKLAVWNCLPQRHLFMDGGDFREVSEEEFESIVADKSLVKEMLHECWLMGISVREAERASR